MNCAFQDQGDFILAYTLLIQDIFIFQTSLPGSNLDTRYVYKEDKKALTLEKVLEDFNLSQDLNQYEYHDSWGLGLPAKEKISCDKM